jgi:hypothetical protein
MAAASLPSVGSGAATISQNWPLTSFPASASSSSVGSGAAPIIQSWSASAPAVAGSASVGAILDPISQAASKTQLLSAATLGQGQSDLLVLQRDFRNILTSVERLIERIENTEKERKEEFKAKMVEVSKKIDDVKFWIILIFGVICWYKKLF